MFWRKHHSLKMAYMYVTFYAAPNLCIVVSYLLLCVLSLLQLESISAKHRSCKVNLALATLYQKTGGNDRSAVTAYKEVLRWNFPLVSYPVV